MGTTTEPPWVHKSQGVASRNGTTTHVVTFSTDGDAPFTPTNGNVLVVVVFGAVTHTVSAGGWTEQQQPVSSGELSIFTVTASGTTSISVAHNGSNYPMSFCVYEFPAGSTITASNGFADSSDTFTALAGLPGTPQLIIAAAGRVMASVGATAGSAVWTAPFVEDADQFVGFATTDGGWMTVAHAINVTSTSVTPAYTATYGGTQVINDREHVILAINAVAPSTTTPFTRDYTLNWRVFGAFTKDTTLNWRVFAAFTQDTTLNWRVFNALTRDTTLNWRVFGAFNQDYTLVWRVLGSWLRDYTMTWRVQNAWTNDYSLAWRVFASFTADTAITWRVFGAFQRDYTISWDVLSGSSFQRDYVLSWRVFNAFSQDYALAWRVYASFTRDYALTWRVMNAFSRDHTLVWRVLTGWTRDYTLVWVILSASPGGGLYVAVWSGTAEVPVVSVTVWDGTTEVPAVVSSVV